MPRVRGFEICRLRPTIWCNFQPESRIGPGLLQLTPPAQKMRALSGSCLVRVWIRLLFRDAERDGGEIKASVDYGSGQFFGGGVCSGVPGGVAAEFLVHGFREDGGCLCDGRGDG